MDKVIFWGTRVVPLRKGFEACRMKSEKFVFVFFCEMECDDSKREVTTRVYAGC